MPWIIPIGLSYVAYFILQVNPYLGKPPLNFNSGKLWGNFFSDISRCWLSLSPGPPLRFFEDTVIVSSDFRTWSRSLPEDANNYNLTCGIGQYITHTSGFGAFWNRLISPISLRVSSSLTDRLPPPPSPPPPPPPPPPSKVINAGLSYFLCC